MTDDAIARHVQWLRTLPTGTILVDQAGSRWRVTPTMLLARGSQLRSMRDAVRRYGFMTPATSLEGEF
jgi:hypothetical protein